MYNRSLGPETYIGLEECLTDTKCFDKVFKRVLQLTFFAIVFNVIGVLPPDCPGAWIISA